MVRVSFTPNLAPHIDISAVDVEGDRVITALEAVFRARPKLRGYILDDLGRVRPHVNVFVDGAMIADREKLTDSVEDTSEIWIFPALSGG